MSAKPPPPPCLAHIKPFHLTHLFIGIANGTDGNDTGNGPLITGDINFSRRRLIFAGQTGQFVFEILKAQIDIQPLLIFAEHFARGLNVLT